MVLTVGNKSYGIKTCTFEMSQKYTMDELFIFTDGSVNVQHKFGCGANLVIANADGSLDDFKPQIKVRFFEDTSSSRLELETLLWALSELDCKNTKLYIFTDSQNIVGLPDRRKKLEENNFRSKKDKPILHADLYRKFYKLTDQLNCTFKKVEGHLPSRKKTQMDKIFALVDKASRKALRERLKIGTGI